MVSEEAIYDLAESISSSLKEIKIEIRLLREIFEKKSVSVIQAV